MKIAGISASLAIVLLLGIGLLFSPSSTPSGQTYYRNITIPDAPTDFYREPAKGISPHQPKGDYYSIPPLKFGSSMPKERYRHRAIVEIPEPPTDFHRLETFTPSKYQGKEIIKRAQPLYKSSYSACLDSANKQFQECYNSYVVGMQNCPTEFTCGSISHTFHTCQQIKATSLNNCKRLYLPIAHNTSHSFD